MRRLVFFLFIANGLVFAWFTFQTDRLAQQEQAIQVFDFEAAPSIQLLSELPKSELLSRNKERIALERRRREAAAKSLCYLVGSFESKDVANRMRVRMDYFEGVKIIEQEAELPSNFWAYMEPQATRQAALALAKRLKSDGLDSYAMPDGDYTNAVALGTFSKEESAQSVADKAKAKGYEVLVAERKRSKAQFFIALDEAKTADFTESLLDKVRPDVPEVKIEEKACKSLALLPAIQ